MNTKGTNIKLYYKIRPDILICLFIVLTTFSVYWQLHGNEFIKFDDDLYFENRHLRAGLTIDNIKWAFSFTKKEGTYWHPLTWISLMFDSQLFGIDSGMYHITSLIFHIANSLLLFLVFKRMTGDLWKSAFVAVLFALHPLNVESVAWATQRPNILSTLFWMFTMLAYIHYTNQPGIFRYFLILISFIMGLMAKPMLITLPFVFLLIDYWPLGRFQLPSSMKEFKRNIIRIKSDISNCQSAVIGQRSATLLYLFLEKIPFLILSVISVFLTIKSIGVVVSTELIPLELRIANALVSYVRYIEKLIWPNNLAILYPFRMVPYWQAVGAGLVLVCLTVFILRVVRTKPFLTVGWLWYLGVLIPVIGIVQTGLQPAMADRYAYISFIGLYVIIAWSLPGLLSVSRYKMVLLTTTAISLLILLMATTFKQVQYWKNSITLFEHTIDVTNQNNAIHNNLGVVLKERGRTEDAIKHYTEALRIKPDYSHAHNNIGYALADQGKINAAIKHYKMALKYKPDYAHAYNNLGNALASQGMAKEALSHYAKALRIKPDYAEAYNNIGVSLYSLGNLEEAIIQFKEALRIKPDYGDARYNLTAVLKKQNKGNDIY
jgi:protein O-mannosyl-transferase